jgi:hypothetical protein
MSLSNRWVRGRSSLLLRQEKANPRQTSATGFSGLAFRRKKDRRDCSASVFILSSAYREFGWEFDTSEPQNELNRKRTQPNNAYFCTLHGILDRMTSLPQNRIN